jgi:catechol 2,3-dioxygenase-like lactoylglutathione lyase family enzyme
MPATPHRVRAVDATYYTVKDIAAQTKFYTDLLGVEPNVAMPGAFSEWTFTDGGSFGLYRTDRGEASGSGVLFAVDDVKAAVEALKAKGVKFDDHQEDLPTCHMAFGEDPEGLSFIIHRRKDGTVG